MCTWGETKVDLTLVPSPTFGNHFAHNAFGAGYFQAEQKFPKCSACWWWCLLQAWIQTRKNKTASVEHMLRSSGSNKQKRNSRYAGSTTVYVCTQKSISR